jgi:hypothetical protein
LVAYTQNLLPQDTDLPAQSLTVALVSGPAGLVVANSVMAWTPTEAQGSSVNEVVVTVSDGSLTTTNSLTLTVREVNVPPTLAGATNATINELVAYSQNLVPQDTDLPAQSLTVALVSGPTGLVVTNGVMAWTPTGAQSSSTNLVVAVVSDGLSKTTNSFTLTVRGGTVVTPESLVLKIAGPVAGNRLELEIRLPLGVAVALEVSDLMGSWSVVQKIVGQGSQNPISVVVLTDPSMRAEFWRLKKVDQ